MSTSSSLPSAGLNTATKLLLLFGVMLVMLLGISVIQTIMAYCSVDIGSRTWILIISAFQSVFVFMLPSYIVARIDSVHPLNVMTLSTKPQSLYIIAALFLMILAVPAINQTVYWNESIDFPDAMSALEDTLRKWENSAAEMTKNILAASSVWEMLVGVLVIGCLTGLGEELFFRAGLQRLLAKCMPVNGAIWLSAAIFSLMHFQFFGFVPRFMLGAVFGYLYFISGSIWVSALAHALNNSLVVVTAWLISRNIIPARFEMFGVDETGFPVLAAASMIAVIIMVAALYRYHTHNKSNKV